MMFKLLNAALAVMQSGPADLAGSLGASAAINRLPPQTPEDLKTYLGDASSGDEAVGAFRRALAGWDNEASADWIESTGQNTVERRGIIYDALGLDADFRRLCESKFPFHRREPPVVIAERHERWYDETRRGRNFYWSAYRRQLESQTWTDEAVAGLDDSTNRVVERLSDPTNPKAYQAKGLVVGYVQSGKTANFTGVIAKAADAGYKLVIVLAGTLDVLRSQTQRRIDKDLIGRELLHTDYLGDAEWDRFLSHGGKPSELGAFDWYRQTGPESDYVKLGRGFEALKFERPDSSKPLWDRDNLFHAGARIAIVKKHSKVLARLIGDLRLLERSGQGAPLSQVPVLVIDDESDQAGINVVKPADAGDEQERTATNKAIVDLLKLFPRAQYVGYTATPFANVFVDPNCAEDIFPRDFIVSLPRPDGYMGVSNFYDLDGTPDDEETRPNRRAYMRPVINGDLDPPNLPKALDSFVLSGAIKLFRAEHDRSLSFRHHTMLAHVSSRVADHEQLAIAIRQALEKGGYEGGKGVDRLAALFESDFRAVSAQRGQDLLFPADFDELTPFIGDALERIGAPDQAIRILNNENRDQTPDFDRQSIWKILVGGTKLSRGYTVEGLTVSYYRRRAQTADTLMQMGRWFGFRRGYHDLVRLFIGTEEKLDKAGRKKIDLYEAFGAVCRDEEMFREALKLYASMDEPRVTPRDIPPLVPMHMLKPTSPNKMYNVAVTFRNFGGRLSESTFAPSEPAETIRNQEALVALLASKPVRQVELAATIQQKRQRVAANVTAVSPAEMIDFLQGYAWFDKRDRKNATSPMIEQIEFLKGQGAKDPKIDDWLLIAPKIKSPVGRWKMHGVEFDVIHRTRNGPRLTTFNDPDHRRMGEHVAGLNVWTDPSDDLEALVRPRRAVALLYLITDTKGPRTRPPYTPGLTLLFPKNDIVSPLTFAVVRKDMASSIIVPRSRSA
jgi:hypothetical protein